MVANAACGRPWKRNAILLVSQPLSYPPNSADPQGKAKKCCSRRGAGLVFGLPLVPAALRVVFFYTQDSRVLVFRLGFLFKMLLSLKRRPQFRVSARSGSSSRCSVGLISRAMPLRLPLAVLLRPFLPLRFLLLLFFFVLLIFLLLIFLLILL